jgi:hypothetical protein
VIIHIVCGGGHRMRWSAGRHEYLHITSDGSCTDLTLHPVKTPDATDLLERQAS